MKRRIIVFLLSLAMLVTYMPAYAFAEDGESVPSNLKFRMSVSSENLSGGTGSVVGSVYNDFSADLKFNNENINRSNATVQFWMQNVQSLGVGKLRTYKKTLNTGLTGPDNQMSSISGMFTSFREGAKIKAVVNGKTSTVYRIQMRDDGNVYATPDSNTQAVWHQIVNEQNIEAGTKTADDSYIVIKNGSWMQIGTKKLEFEKNEDLKLDDFNNMTAMNTAIREAVTLANKEKAEKVEIVLQPGTELAMGNSYAKLKEVAKITIDISGVDEAQFEKFLVDLKNAKSLSEMIKSGLLTLNDVLESMGGRETVVNIDFGEKTEPEDPEVTDDYKFRMKVSSEDSTGAVGSVTGTVHSDYKADLKFDGENVNRSNATVDFWMQNVASLGVDAERHYSKKVETGLTGPDNQMSSISGMFTSFRDESTIKAIVNGKETTVYTIKMADDGNVYATPDENVATVWHAIVNEQNIEAGTKKADDSYIVIKNGSWMQIGSKKLEFEKNEDLKLDDFNNMTAMNTAIREAVTLANKEKAEKIEIYLEPGTELAMGNSYAKLKDAATITIDISDVDEADFENILTDLKEAKTLSELISKGLISLNNVLENMGGKETVVTIDFGKKTEPEVKDDYKFRMKVSSEDSTGAVGSVTGTVHSDYKADLKFDGENVNRSNATVDFWMQNVASLGVDKERHYNKKLETGLTGPDNQMSSISGMFTSFRDESTIKAIVNGKETTVYTIKMADDGNVYATPDENVATVWHAIVNDKNIEAGTKTADDSYIVIKNGSWMQIGSKKLEFEKNEDLKLDDFNNMTAMNTAIREAVTLANKEKADKIEIYLEPGTELAMGSSYAKLKDDVKITIDISDVDEADFENILTELKEAKTLSELISKGLISLNNVLENMGGRQTVVTFDFGHKYGDAQFIWGANNASAVAIKPCVNNPEHKVTVTAEVTSEITKPATCEAEGEKTITASALFEGDKTPATDTRKEAIEATGHAYGEPTWTWSEDFKTAKAKFTCANDASHVEEVTAEITSEIKKSTCVEDGETVYTAKVSFGGKDYEDKKSDAIEAIGHAYGEPTWTWSEDFKTARVKFTCANDASHVEEVTAEITSETKKATCEEAGETVYTAKASFGGKDYEDKKSEAIEATGHKYGEPTWAWSEDFKTAKAKFTCANDASHTLELDASITSEKTEPLAGRDGKTVYTAKVTLDGKDYTDTKEEVIEAKGEMLRIAGATRYSTAFKNADKLKELLNVDKFDTVIITTGENFPDALSGSYLAYENKAPLLLINKTYAKQTRDYINENLKPGGRIIILGSTLAVKDEWLEGLPEGERLSGADRYETNLLILKELGYTGGDILVSTGENYADGLSGSSLKMPILLVNGNGKLSDSQKQFLKGLKSEANMYIAGSTYAVSASMEKSLKDYGTVVKRFAGTTRYDTSMLIAEEFFKDSKSMILTVGNNYPDGLSVGPIAITLDVPILLVTDETANRAFAKKYARGHQITDGIIVGSDEILSEATAKDVIANKDIIHYEKGMYE